MEIFTYLNSLVTIIVVTKLEIVMLRYRIAMKTVGSLAIKRGMKFSNPIRLNGMLEGTD